MTRQQWLYITLILFHRTLKIALGGKSPYDTNASECSNIFKHFLIYLRAPLFLILGKPNITTTTKRGGDDYGRMYSEFSAWEWEMGIKAPLQRLTPLETWDSLFLTPPPKHNATRVQGRRGAWVNARNFTRKEARCEKAKILYGRKIREEMLKSCLKMLMDEL